MKNKIIVVLLVFILISLTNVSAQKILQEEPNIPKPQNKEYDHFSLCIIRGTYESKSYNDGFLVLKNQNKKNDTIKITGIAWWYEYGELLSPTFASVTTHKVIASEFYGICFNGRVFGIGRGFVDYED